MFVATSHVYRGFIYVKTKKFFRLRGGTIRFETQEAVHVHIDEKIGKFQRIFENVQHVLKHEQALNQEPSQ